MLSRLGTFVDTAGWRRRYHAFPSAWPGRSRPGIGFYRTRKVQYRYRLQGDGPTVIFLADPPVTIEAYDHLYDVLTPFYRVMVIEAAGMGFSAANHRYGFGFRESNDDIARLLRDIAGPQSILAFSCAAGLAAVDIAVRHSDLVSRLLLFQTTDWDGFQLWMKGRDPKGLLRKPVIGQLGLKKMASSRAPQWVNFATGKRDMVAPLCRCVADGFDSGMMFSLASSFQRYLTGDNPLDTPTQPVTIVWGEQDRSHGTENIARSRNLAPQASLIMRPSLGHFPELEDVEGTLELLKATL